MSLKKKIFLSFFALIVTIFSVFSFYTFNATSKIISEREQDGLIVLSNSIKTQMDKQVESAEIGSKIIANDPEVKRLFAERDRQGLIDFLNRSYKEISDVMTQGQFHLPDSVSFLRLHDVEKYGDDLSGFRHTVNEANKEKKIVRGLEEGVSGYGFRAVIPMEYEGRLIGSFELGSDFSNKFLTGLKETYGSNFFIYTIDGTEYISGTSEEDIWYVDKTDELKDKLKNYRNVYEMSPDKKYNLSFVPFKDYSGQVMGYVKIVTNREGIISQLGLVKRNAIMVTSLLAMLAFIVFYIILNKALNPISDLSRLAEDIAGGDLNKRVNINSRDEIGKLGGSFNKMAENLRTILATIGEMAENVAATSEELSASSEEVSAATEEVAETVSYVAQSIDEETETIEYSKNQINCMSTSIRSLNTNVSLINESMENTLEVSKKGIKSANKAVEKILSLKDTSKKTTLEINKLSESSRQIEEILNTISEIAEQTNLLALNAAIEAARAGDAGKGFSVVAEEVRKLAEESSNSSNQIDSLIKTIQGDISKAVVSMNESNLEVETSVSAVNESNEGFKEIEFEIGRVLDKIIYLVNMMVDVNNITEGVMDNFEKSLAMARVNLEGVEGVNTTTKEQTRAMEDISQATVNLAEMASDLRDSLGKFKY